MTDHSTEAAVVRDLTLTAAEPVLIETVPGRRSVLVAPHGAELHDVDHDRFAARPARHTGTARFDDPDSFLAYVNELSGDESGSTTGFYGDADRLQVLAVFNDHGLRGPGWRDFRAVLRFEATPEWDAWTDADTKFMPATAFAEHLEQWQHTVLSPTAGELRDLVTSFRATKQVTFGDEIRDQNGDRSLQWTEQTTGGSSRTGAIDIPEALTLELAPFTGAEPTEVTARFRYRVDGGQAGFGVVLVQPDKLVRDAFANEVAEIGEQVGARVMLGTPAEG